MKKIAFASLFLSVFAFIPSVAGAASDRMCTMQYAPVCAAKQVQCIKAPCYPVYQTYGNSCQMEADNAKFIHAGACTPAETGPIKGPKEEATSTAPYVPPPSCVSWNDGCNICSKQQDGRVICTLRACPINYGPGYCTAYMHSTSSSSTPDLYPGWHHGTTTATSTASTSPWHDNGLHRGFFKIMFIRWMHWFGFF